MGVGVGVGVGVEPVGGGVGVELPPDPPPEQLAQAASISTADRQIPDFRCFTFRSSPGSRPICSGAAVFLIWEELKDVRGKVN